MPLERRTQEDLAPGGYFARTFRPPFRFRVGSGWNLTYLPPAFLALSIGAPEPLRPRYMTFQRLRKVVEPKASNLFTGRYVSPPKDLVGWLLHHPYMEVSTPTRTQVAGINAVQLDAVFTSAPKRYGAPGLPQQGCPAPCVLMWTAGKPDDYVFFFKGQSVRFVVLPIHGGDLVITIESLTEEFSQVLMASQPILSTVSFVT